MYYKLLLALIVTVTLEQSAIAETQIEHQCTDALMDATKALMSTNDSRELNIVVNNSTKFLKVRRYISTKWIPKVRGDKSFTTNTFIMNLEEYVKECASSASQ